MSHVKRIVAKFDVGELRLTRGAAEQLPIDDVVSALARHCGGDWGSVDEHDRRENDDALLSGRRLFSQYVDRRSTRFWIITEADRSATTVLLPDEY